MTGNAQAVARPDVQAVLAGLKDFQRDTVDCVFRRLYLDADTTHRFLVADEVGLGKTLVARGVIAKAVDYLWDRVRRIDIVYICSNGDIARQNVNRLRIGDQEGFALASRITLLPAQVKNLRAHKVNFISFTPGTSFNLHSSGGRVEERALLYWLLKRSWGLSNAMAPLNVLQGGAHHETFRSWVTWYDQHREIDEEISRAFAHALERRIAHQRQEGEVDLRMRFDDLCRRFPRGNTRASRDDERARYQLIGELRGLLATTCLAALEPDLIILDEFQRFKHLLHGTDAASELARGLFEYSDDSDERSRARVLLLSATPYKMYTLADEAASDDHFADFANTVSFLDPEADPTAFPQLLRNFRRELYRLADGGGDQLPRLKAALEAKLRRVMVRTERLAVTADRDGMLVHRPSDHVTLEARDVESYRALQDVARALRVGDAMEYWKAAPYLLNFMEGYEINRALDAAQRNPAHEAELAELLSRDTGLLLDWSDVSRYREIDPGNARLRALCADTLDKGAWRLLWIPPALPYYRLAGAYADPTLARLTKRLVFSSWKVVPRAVASLLSYQAERQMIRTFEDDPQNSPEARVRRRALLRFARTDGRLTGMPVLGLLYPCAALARACDPLLVKGEDPAGLPALDTTVASTRRHVEQLLNTIPPHWEGDGPEDEAWYWAAPILLDLVDDPTSTSAWLNQPRLDLLWAGEIDAGSEGEESRWTDHVTDARRLAAGEVRLGHRPADLADVLTLSALGAPGTAALRAVSRVACSSSASSDLTVRNAAAQVAWGFRTLFNLPEVMALLRGTGHSMGQDTGRDWTEEDASYWRRILQYAVDGCLQAVLDEYAHVLREGLGLVDASPQRMAKEMGEAMRRALTLRTSSLGVDDVRAKGKRVEISPGRMRTRFALAFTQQRAEDGKEGARLDQVREAFNSPFWPFVLVSTSVGQEGLDFHPCCHAVVHWNLPANPVDLEQREGRVHRYKGHAVRRNLALRHGGAVARDAHADIWQAMFDRAKGERPVDTSDLVPYWIYPVEGGESIERHVPALPLSRDAERFGALRRSLAVYRMVFGQPRQEDLVAYLLSRLSKEQIERMTAELRVDLSPPSTYSSAPS
ncbi:MAG: DEAD/DEAH box helicase [Chloroflexi bacterium]|nr:DEAD/DEAH box helicase [Chloroflexota bacterium]